MDLVNLFQALQNIGVAFNNLGGTFLYYYGRQRSPTITSVTPTLLYNGQGRVGSVSVLAITATNTGMIYDSSKASSLSSPLAVIPDVVGIHQINMPFDNGLVIVLGTGMQAVISYSEAVNTPPTQVQ